MRTQILAEPGSTAEGQHDVLIALLDTAADCGATAWKPQWTSDPDAMVSRRHVPGIYRQYYGWLAWPQAWHEDFARRCHAREMLYGCSVYLSQDLAVVARYVDFLKIASFEATDTAFVEAALDTVIPVIVSAGMLGARPCYARDRQPLVLHSCSCYPAPWQAMNLRVLPHFDGLSDHSRCLMTGALAVGQGAGIVETHYRLDTCKAANPDYAVAFTPAEYTQYIQHIRDAEQLLGDGVLRVQPCEQALAQYQVRGRG